jgi:RNase P subunit RPR2
MMDRSVYDFHLRCQACESHEWHLKVVLEPNETQKLVILTCPECDTTRRIEVKRQEPKFPIKAVKSDED